MRKEKTMLTVANITKQFDNRDVLCNVSFAVGRGQKIALVGYNGTGKSTLLKVIAGIVKSDSGTVDIEKETRIGYLPQDTSALDKVSIQTYLKSVTGIDRLEKDMARLENHLSEEGAQRHYSTLQTTFDHAGGYLFDHRASVMMAGFGLEDIGLQRPMTNLSSGQKSKIALIGILLKGADLLLLDEPTNNLDLPSLIWLEQYLREQNDLTAIIVSHDRRFLDTVTRKIIELDWHTHDITIENGTYSDYLERKVKERQRQSEAFEQQQEEIERLKQEAQSRRAEAASGARYRGTDNDKFQRGFKRDRAGRSGKAARAIERRIEQMDIIEKPFERDPLIIPLSPDTPHGTRDITLRQVVSGYEGGFYLEPVDLHIAYGTHIVLIGANGSGKSTLLKTIVDALAPRSGAVSIGSGIVFGDLMQEHETLPRDISPFAFLAQKIGFREDKIYALCAKFGIESAQIKIPIETLSPGSRARLLFALYSAQSVNTLVLDEPTNHLDLEALEALEELLSSYTGTVLLVTHDRSFLECIRINDLYQIIDGNIERIPDLDAYIEQARKKAKRLVQLI